MCRILLSSDGYHEGRQLAPGGDIYSLEQRWREWMSEGALERPRDPDAAFSGFCGKWPERHGAPS